MSHKATRLIGPKGPFDVKNTDGTIDIAWQDQHTLIVDHYFHKNLGSVTIASDTAIDDLVISFENGHGIQVGEVINFKEDSRFTQLETISVSSNDITFDSPLDYPYTTAAFVHRGNKNLAIDGSSTTQTFSVRPPINTRWDVTRIILAIQDDNAIDTSKFGGAGMLTNGILLRKKNAVYKNIFNAKTNGEIQERGYDMVYTDRAPAGKFGLTFRRTFSGLDKNGVTVRLDGDLNEELQMLIRDDLTGLEYMHVIAQGHVVE